MKTCIHSPVFQQWIHYIYIESLVLRKTGYYMDFVLICLVWYYVYNPGWDVGDTSDVCTNDSPAHGSSSRTSLCRSWGRGFSSGWLSMYVSITLIWQIVNIFIYIYTLALFLTYRPKYLLFPIPTIIVTIYKLIMLLWFVLKR